MKRFILPSLLLIVIVIASCNTTKPTAAISGTFDPQADRKELVGTTWTIQQLYGKDIEQSGGRNLPYLNFTDDGKLQGHTGCNPINGTYSLEEGFRIKFSGLATGLALCQNVPYERDFLDVLNTADNFTIHDGELSLNKARMTPMAVLKKTE